MKFNAYHTTADAYFASPPPDVERFQPLPENATFEAIETSYFGFNIPEHAINGEIYHWFHPALGVASGGVYIYQGMKPRQELAECLDWRHSMPIPRDLADQTYPTGVRVRMLKPGAAEFRLEYEDAERDTRFDFTTVPIMPAAVRHTGNHLIQAMRTRGMLVLRGKRYEIDGFFTRDRSWAENRSEKPLSIPPLTWITGVFDENFAFHAMAFDGIEQRPEWRSAYPDLQPGKNHLWGYVYRDGHLRGIRATRKFTHREADNITPKAYDLAIEDADGRTFEIHGRAIARQPLFPFTNQQCFITLNRWECEGRIGHGDAQEVIFADYARQFLISS